KGCRATTPWRTRAGSRACSRISSAAARSSTGGSTSASRGGPPPTRTSMHSASEAVKHAVPPAEVSLRRFGSPRYWPTWALWLCMRALSALPLRMQIKVGKLLARPLLKLKARERRTAERNLAACFPELAPDERDALLRRHFEAL